MKIYMSYTCLSLAKRLPKMGSAKQNPWFQKYRQPFLHEWMFSTVAGRKKAVMSTLCDVIVFSPRKTRSKILFADRNQCFHPRKGIKLFQMHISEHVLNRCGGKTGCYKPHSMWWKYPAPLWQKSCQKLFCKNKMFRNIHGLFYCMNDFWSPKRAW